MKINFLGPFRDTHRLVSVPIGDLENKPDFQDLLASISPDKPKPLQPLEAKEIKMPFSWNLELEGRAQPNFSKPELKPAALERVASPVKPETAVNEPAVASVKSPTILGARRLTVKDSFNNLKPDQRVDAVRKLVEEAGLKHGVDPVLSLAVVSAESAFNALAISTDGHDSKGLMQLLDTTGRQELERGGGAREYQPFDPELNVDLGVSYLRYLHDLFSQESELPNKQRTVAAANSSSLEKLAVASFNAGEGRVAAAQQRALKAGKDAAMYDQIEMYLPESTQEYVRRVLAAKADFEGRFIG